MTAIDHMSPALGRRLDYVTDFGSCMRMARGADRYELIIVERGTLQLEIDGGLASLAARDAAIVSPNQSYRAISASEPGIWLARFDAAELDIGLPAGGARVRRLAAEHHEALFAVLRWLSDTVEDGSAYRRLVRRLHFTAVIASVLGSADVREFEPSHANALVREALTIIDRRYAENIGPAEIARELGRHPAYLTNLVRETTGKSLGAWLIERRLGAARVLLCKTSDSVGDIAAAVGYVDGSHFARYFTRHYGTPPARWRRLRNRRDGDAHAIIRSRSKAFD